MNTATPSELATAQPKSSAPSFLANLERWRQRIKGRRDLARLDTKMLKDIGLTEADRYNEINKPFWR